MNDIVEAFQKEGVLLDKFRSELEKAVEQLPALEKKPTLVFFVDEIDRCRPTFSIELLERIKHLFDVPNILFVLSLDKKQLEASIAAVYGHDINAPEYLRRFIDLEYAIPEIKTKKFVEGLLSRFGFDEVFAARAHSDLRYDRSNFVDFFAALAGAIPLSLRAQERCMTRLRVVLDQTPENHYLDPVLVAVLIVLRVAAPHLFENLKLGAATATDVMSYLKNLPGGRQVVGARMGTVIEANLIVADEDEDRKEAVLNALNTTAQDENSHGYIHARELLEVVGYLQRPMRGTPRLSRVVNKIELASSIRE